MSDGFSPFIHTMAKHAMKEALQATPRITLPYNN